ncbi:MAG: EamA family transporter [Alphaproteobacteria bacterium]
MLGAMTLGWGLFWPFMQIALAEMPILTFRAICAEAGGAILLLIALATGDSIRIPRNEWGGLLVIAFVNSTLWLMLTATGVVLLGSGRAVLLAYTMPLWAFLFGIWLLGERPRQRQYVGLGLGLAGVAVLVAPSIFGDGDLSLPGVLAMLGAAMVWAGGGTLVKRRSWAMSMPTLSGWQLVIGGLPICFAAAVLEADRIGPISWVASLALAYNVLIGVSFGVYVWFRLVQTLPMSVASMAVLLVPVIGLTSSAWLVDAPLGWPELGSLALIVLGVSTVVPMPKLANLRRRTS